METAASTLEAVQGPMRDSGPGSSMRRRYGGPWQITGLAAAMGGPTGTHETLWTWQQHEEAAVRGPMAD
ncbi:unnamed protein product [Staurois parvus]|uniref:Uncharacterized protein n=1 Tax=Staurois parvus TaxID=386267 RepID=A0ABN9C696_9NEOB|nr:unnamed protein product [Staurois parvus]